MQVKQSVTEYCNINKVTSQSVYARIKRGTLKSVKENGITMLLIEDTTPPAMDDEQHTQPKSNDVEMLLQSIIKDKNKEIKRLHKTIKQLQAQVHKDMDLLLNILSGETKPMQIGLNSSTDDVIDVPIGKAVKSHSKGKKGKKKKKK